MLELTWSRDRPAPQSTRLVIVPARQGFEPRDMETNLRIGGLAHALSAARFAGKPGEQFRVGRTVESDGGELVEHVLVAGIDEAPIATTARRLGFAAARQAVELGVPELVIELGDGWPSASGEAIALALATGLELGTYRYDRFIAEEDRVPRALRRATIVSDLDANDRVLARGQTIASAVALARDLANGPADLVTPTHLAEQAVALADRHRAAGRDVTCTVLERDECERLGMGCYLGVARGSDTPPKFIHLTYRPAGTSRGKICLVGKGVTFDSGGYSLKPTDGMYGMKLDMSGAATVIGALDGVATLGLDYEVHVITAATENMVSGHAYRLGDVLIASDGTSVEVNNTDAEGRLTLADALVYARKLQPDLVIDFATLTGACIVALGPHIAGVMSPDDALVDDWMGAAERAGEQMWRLPLPEALESMLESKIADLRNTGERAGGALTAGLFLRRFAEGTRWLHVDMAGPGMCTKPFDVNVEGGTGFGVATVLALLSEGDPIVGAPGSAS